MEYPRNTVGQMDRDSVDKNGNQTTKTNIATGKITEYSWGFENRLVQTLINPNANTQLITAITYHYDAYGRRIEKNVNGNIK